MNLDELRNSIDEVDRDILVALSRRRDIVRKIGEVKKKMNLKLKDTARWQEVLVSRKLLAKELDIPEAVAISIWDTLHEWALEVEAGKDD